MESTALDQEVFDNNCLRYLATHLEHYDNGVYDGGVYGGEQDIRRDDDFSPLRGGRPKGEESDSEVVGRQWRDKVRAKISRRGLICPHTN